MKYLILPFDDAETLNMSEAVMRGAYWPEAKMWDSITSIDGTEQALVIESHEIPQGYEGNFTNELTDKFAKPSEGLAELELPNLAENENT